MYQPLPQILLCLVWPDPGGPPAAVRAPLACSLSCLGVSGGCGMCCPRAASSAPRAEPLLLPWGTSIAPHPHLRASFCLSCCHPERSHAGALLGGFLHFSGLLVELTGSDTSALPRSQLSEKASCFPLPLERGLWGGGGMGGASTEPTQPRSQQQQRSRCFSKCFPLGLL